MMRTRFLLKNVPLGTDEECDDPTQPPRVTLDPVTGSCKRLVKTQIMTCGKQQNS